MRRSGTKEIRINMFNKLKFELANYLKKSGLKIAYDKL